MDRRPHAAHLRRRTLNVEEVADRLGINRSTAYDLIRIGEFPLPVVRLGRRIVVPRHAVVDLLGPEQGDDAA